MPNKFINKIIDSPIHITGVQKVFASLRAVYYKTHVYTYDKCYLFFKKKYHFEWRFI